MRHYHQSLELVLMNFSWNDSDVDGREEKSIICRWAHSKYQSSLCRLPGKLRNYLKRNEHGRKRENSFHLLLLLAHELLNSHQQMMLVQMNLLGKWNLQRKFRCLMGVHNRITVDHCWDFRSLKDTRLSRGNHKLEIRESGS